MEIDRIIKLTASFAYWAEQSIEKIAAAKKSKKKLNPKAKIRNRGKCVFPAESSNVSDHKDHYPLHNIDQARAAHSAAGLGEDQALLARRPLSL